MIQRSLAAALAAVVVFGLTACAGAATPAALHYTDEGTEWCAPAATYRDLVVGIPLDTSGENSITLTGVTPVDADGIQVIGAWAVPIDPNNRIGTDRWPISKSVTWWKKRERAVGAELKQGTHHDLVLHLLHTGKGSGKITNIRVKYRQGSADRTADTFTTIRIAKNC